MCVGCFMVFHLCISLRAVNIFAKEPSIVIMPEPEKRECLFIQKCAICELLYVILFAGCNNIGRCSRLKMHKNTLSKIAPGVCVLWARYLIENYSNFMSKATRER